MRQLLGHSSRLSSLGDVQFQWRTQDLDSERWGTPPKDKMRGLGEGGHTKALKVQNNFKTKNENRWGLTFLHLMFTFFFQGHKNDCSLGYEETAKSHKF